MQPKYVIQRSFSDEESPEILRYAQNDTPLYGKRIFEIQYWAFLSEKAFGITESIS